MRVIGLAVVLALVLAPFLAEAQPPGKLPLVGVLEPGRQEFAAARCRPAFEQSLRDLGYVEGRTVRFAYRFGEDRADRLPALAAELVQLAPDVIWLHSTPAAVATKQATTTIPSWLPCLRAWWNGVWWRVWPDPGGTSPG
jgi:ABC-type uncharacterized transport system substrate-binding protein